MTKRAKGINNSGLKKELDQNFKHQLKLIKRVGHPDLIMLFQPMIILAYFMMESTWESRLSVDTISGIAFLLLYIVIEMTWRRWSYLNAHSSIYVLLFRFLVQLCLAYNAFNLLQKQSQNQKDNTPTLAIQIAFHAYLLLIFSSLDYDLDAKNSLKIKYTLLWVVQIIYFSIELNKKYYAIQYRFYVDIIIFIQLTLVHYYQFKQASISLNIIKKFSFQADINKLKFNKLEFFIHNLESQSIICVQQTHNLKNLNYLDHQSNILIGIFQTTNRIFSNFQNKLNEYPRI